MRYRFVRSAINIAFVNESVAEDTNIHSSIHRHSQQLGLFYGTLLRILHLNLHLHLYKLQVTQQLKPADHSQCRRYLEWVLGRQFFQQNFLQR